MSELRPHTRALLQRAARGHEPTADDRARVRAGIARSLAAGAVVAGAGAVATKSAAASIAPAAIGAAAAGAGGAASTAAVGGASAAVVAGTSTAVKIAATVILVGSVGAGAVTLSSVRASHEGARAPAATTAVVRAATAPTRPVLPNGVVLPEVPRDVVAEAPTAPTAPTTNVLPIAADPPAIIDARRAPARAAAKPSTLDDRSALAEVALMREAQVALRAGDAPRALRLADEHEHRYPFGALAEEREAMRVFALCDLGRVAESSAEATIFLSAHPRSPIADRVRSSCGFKKDP